MRKEFGKWLLDIAKYLATAVIISSIFTGVETAKTFIYGTISLITLLVSGLLLISDTGGIRRRNRSNRTNQNN